MTAARTPPAGIGVHAASGGGARAYRTSRWLRSLLGLAFAAFVGGAVAVRLFEVVPDDGLSVVLLMLAGFTWPLWSLARRRRVVIDDRGIAVVEWKRPRRLELADIRGFRRTYWHNAVNLLFEPRQTGGRPLPVRVMSSMDSAFEAWLRQVPDLDALSGAPAGQREAFDRDRRLARTINRVALAISAWSFLPIGYEPGTPGSPWVWPAAVPFLMPLVAMGVVLGGRGRFTLAERGREDPRPTLFLTFFLPGMMAGVRPIHEFQPLSLGPVFAAAAGCSALVCALAWLCDRTLRGRRALVLLLLVPLMTLPSFGALLVVNCAADDSAPTVRATTVLDKTFARGRGGAYFLELAPWEPTMQREKLRVSATVFDRAAVGRPVSVLTKPGWLGFPWAWVE